MDIRTIFPNTKLKNCNFRTAFAKMINLIAILAFLFSAVGVTPASAATSSIWPDPITPTYPYYNDPGPVEVGLKFRTDIAGYITGVRYFKGPGSTGTRIGRLWSMAGEKLAEVPFTNETASGWQEALFPTPVAIQPNTTYIISYYVADGNRMLAISQNFFTSSGVTNGHLYALKDNEDGHNGVFSETGGFFNQDNLSSNYWVDLIFDETQDKTPPIVTSVSPTDGATGVFASTNVSIVFSEAMNASSINASSLVLHDPSNNDVAASISYDTASHTAILNPTSNLNFSTTYTAIVLGGAGGVTDFAGNPLDADYSWSFTVEDSDTTRPSVGSVSPASSATEVLISTSVLAVFSEAMDESTINAANFELRDPYDVPVPAAVTYDSGANTAILDPIIDLNYGAVYTACIKGDTTGVKDVGGNTMATDYIWTFTTTAPPMVGSVSPTAGAVDVLISSDVSAVFSKAMDGNTINSNTFELRDSSNNPVSASLTYNPASYTVILNPTSNLAYATIYTTMIRGGTDGVKDVVGNSLASDYTWSFATESLNTTPPTVISVKPINGVTKLRLETKATAYFSRAMDPNSINSANFELRNALGTLVPANVTYNPSDNSAVLVPVSMLDYSTTYTARILSGPAGYPTDINGIAMAADYSWSFTTIAQRPPVDQAPGGPILIITSPTNLFTRYYVEIIRTEGFNEYALMDIGAVTPEALGGYDIVVLGDMALTSGQVTTLSDWVTAGGHLIAMRPDKQLTGLLGLTDASSTLSNAYLLIDTSTGPGAGIVGQTLQFHGTADQYTLNGATSLATLYSTATTATTYPAVTLRSVGANGGQAAAFTFDLARSIVYTHQGNPAWQTGHVNPYQGYGTAVDLFAGIGGEPNWIDFSKINIPQADEQQRFLANLILELNADEMPLPRFWYFPSFKKAAIILTGDDHIGRGSPSGSSQIFFDRHIAQSPLGCSAQDWECVRSSSYGYVGNTISDATYAAYTAQGFEFGVHADAGLASGGGWCGTWPADMLAQFTAQYNALFDKFASLPVQSSERDHCYSWFGYTGPEGWIPYTATPEGNEAQGIRLDTNISYNPAGWATVNPGYQMGSGMLMRFAQVDSSGVMHRFMDIYNGGTQMNDDNGQGPAAMRTIVDSYLDAAIGPKGYYGAFVVNMHSDNWYGWSYDGSDQIVASAQARNIPVVSGAQMVEWLDGRNSSYFSNITMTGDTLSFNITQANGARNLRAMLPTQFGGNPLTLLERNGSPISMSLETVKGVEYVIFDASSGSYSATYTPDTFPPAISSLTAEPAVGGTAEITWMTNEASTTRVDYGTDPNNLWLSTTSTGLVIQHTVQLDSLLPHTTYYFRVTSSDESGNAATYPFSGDAPASFITPSAAFIDTTVSDFSAGSPDANLAISQIDNGEVMLKPIVYEEFNGTTLPAGWGSFFDMPGAPGSVTVSGGKLTVDGANAGTTALFGPGHAVEFTATFTASPNQHAGFGVNHTANVGDAWAIFSTGQSGTQLVARSYNGTAPWDTASTVIPGSFLGSPHRYRVDWQANQIIYSVDGAVVATHNVTITIQMRPLVSEGGAGGASFSVDQLQMGPFPASGQFNSRILDALGTVTDGTIAWDAVVPLNTALTISVRTGNTPTPDETWSTFAQFQNGNPIGSGFRYVQYQANFVTTDTAVTPMLQEVRIPYNTTPDAGAPQITSRIPAPGANVYSDVDVSVTFSEPMQPGSITVSSFWLREVGSDVDVAADLSYSGLTATLHPQALLIPSRQYQVTVAGTVTDLSGNLLGADDIWTFTVIQLPGPPWMDTDWAYRRGVTIASSCAQVQTDYPVKIILDSTFDFANAKPDGSDLRITLLDGVTAVPFWIESWSSGSAVVWAKLSSLPLEEVGLYLYYGNPAATSLSNSAGVFSFSDEFSGTSLDLTKWTIKNGTPPTFNNGVMTLFSNAPYGRLDSIPVFGQGYMVEALMLHPQAGISNMVSEVGFAADFANTLRIMDDFPVTANVTNWQWVTDASGLPQGSGIMTQTTLNTGWNHFRIGRIAGMASLQVNEWTPTTVTTNLPTANLPAFLMSYGNNNQMQVDWLLVRKWCGSEPTSMVGDKESLNIPPVAANDTYATNAGVTLSVTAPGVLTNDTDANSDPLTAVKVNGPAHGAFLLNANGSFTYAPTPGFSGEDTFTYKANDGSADSNVATVTIHVINLAPVLNAIGDKSIDELVELAFTATASDVEPLTFSLVGAPGGAAITAGGSFTWTPTEAQGPGSYTFTIKVCDTGSPVLCDEEVITVTVNEVTVTHSLALVPGWNLVSFNLVPVNTNIATVLSGITGKYDLVYAWDATVGSNNWKKYAPSAPSYSNSLSALDEKMGFWIHMTAASTLDVVGNVPAITSIDLSTAAGGWNLVAYPAATNRTLPAVLSENGVGLDFSMVYAYHANQPADPWKLFDRSAPAFVNDLTELAPGWGYWIKVSVSHTWDVEY